jgi:hypothetical protein
VELSVGINRDDHVGAQAKGGVHPRLEGRREALMPLEADDVVDASRSSDAGRSVPGSRRPPPAI